MSKDFAFYLGETWAFDCTLNDANGSPINLTGATIQMRFSSGSGPAASEILTLAVGAGITVNNAAAGTCTAVVAPAQQSGFRAGRAYRYELRLTMADGSVSTQADGQVSINHSLFNG